MRGKFEKQNEASGQMGCGKATATTAADVFYQGKQENRKTKTDLVRN
jgi:hypothetical protein